MATAIHIRSHDQHRLDTAAAPGAPVRFSSAETPDVRTPSPKDSPTEWTVHTTKNDDSKLNIPPSSRKPPSLLRMASKSVTVVLDKSNVFPPEPKHEDESIRPKCTFRGCLITSWVVTTVVCICLIILALTVTDDQQEIAELQKQMSVVWKSGVGVIDSCSAYSTCSACLAQPVSENCVWVMNATKEVPPSFIPSDIPSDARPCRTAGYSLSPDETVQISLTGEDLEEQQCNVPVALATQTSNTEKCQDYAEVANCPTACVGTNNVCCALQGFSLNVNDTSVKFGTCTSEASYCMFSEQSGQCAPSDPIG